MGQLEALPISPNTVISPERKAAYPQPESGITRYSIVQGKKNGAEFGRAKSTEKFYTATFVEYRWQQNGDQADKGNGQ